MTPNPTRRKARRRNDAQRERSRAGVAARENLRAARAEALRDVGGLTTDGVLGAHTIRLLSSATYDARRSAITVDGQHRQARTMRGILRVLALMIHQAQTRQERATP